MNQRFLSGLSAALVISSLGIASSSYGSESSLGDKNVGEIVPTSTASVNDASEVTLTKSGVENDSTVDLGRASESSSLIAPSNSQVAVIHAHVVDGRQAATVYVRGIPVVTFLGDDAIAQATSTVNEPSSTSVNDQESSAESTASDTVNSLEKKTVRTFNNNIKPIDTLSPVSVTVQEVEASTPLKSEPSSNLALTSLGSIEQTDSLDPVENATAIATRLNQLYTSDIDPDEIVAEWDDSTELFVIRAGDTVLIEFESGTILPDTTGSLSDDVMQATNRIRRQFGAAPITAIEGLPSNGRPTVSGGSVQSTFTGRASWYGPGFHGRRSASGEVFNQHALTAAHRTLPFGTLVRVTNVSSGASVTVRINDRGPFGGGRVIDLSAGAAQEIGMIRSGVATVRVDVLN
ncbi:MAG: septal ring lytic transglycosylase RlpA family protein [Cyanobacteria bacterium P01_A01_bin.37]